MRFSVRSHVTLGLRSRWYHGWWVTTFLSRESKRDLAESFSTTRSCSSIKQLSRPQLLAFLNSHLTSDLHTESFTISEQTHIRSRIRHDSLLYRILPHYNQSIPNSPLYQILNIDSPCLRPASQLTQLSFRKSSRPQTQPKLLQHTVLRTDQPPSGHPLPSTTKQASPSTSLPISSASPLSAPSLTPPTPLPAHPYPSPSASSSTLR